MAKLAAEPDSFRRSGGGSGGCDGAPRTFWFMAKLAAEPDSSGGAAGGPGVRRSTEDFLAHGQARRGAGFIPAERRGVRGVRRST